MIIITTGSFEHQSGVFSNPATAVVESTDLATFGSEMLDLLRDRFKTQGVTMSSGSYNAILYKGQ